MRRAALSLLADDERARAVDENASRNATEGAKRSDEAFTPVVLTLAQRRLDVDPSRVAQHGDEEADPGLRTGEVDPLLAEVDLQLASRRRLEANRASSAARLPARWGARAAMRSLTSPAAASTGGTTRMSRGRLARPSTSRPQLRMCDATRPSNRVQSRGLQLCNAGSGIPGRCLAFAASRSIAVIAPDAGSSRFHASRSRTEAAAPTARSSARVATARGRERHTR